MKADQSGAVLGGRLQDVCAGRCRLNHRPGFGGAPQARPEISVEGDARTLGRRDVDGRRNRVRSTFADRLADARCMKKLASPNQVAVEIGRCHEARCGTLTAIGENMTACAMRYEVKTGGCLGVSSHACG